MSGAAHCWARCWCKAATSVRSRATTWLSWKRTSSPYLALEAATDDTSTPLPPEVAARHLRSALRAYTSGGDAPSQAVPVALPENDGSGLEDDVKQLTRLSRALTAHS
ncbi:DUF6545 domain-containing protein [Streptomyces sp. NPDC052020]|uniref:DUF6545 domain-containing protein n=1 Tax=Streptomyces sp. NPDC052020 TaxID=3155677 RepID=UPI0034266D03